MGRRGQGLWMVLRRSKRRLHRQRLPISIPISTPRACCVHVTPTPRSCATRSRSTTASLGLPNQPERSLDTGLPVDSKHSRDLTGPLTRSTASFTVLRDPPNLLLQPSQIHHCARELSAARSHQPSKKSTLSSTVSPRSWACSISWSLYIRSLHVCI